MPSDESTWLLAVPDDDDNDHILATLSLPAAISPLPLPAFKTGTLDALIALSDVLPKHDAAFTATVAHTVDALRSLANNDAARLAPHLRVDDRTPDDYLLRAWQWNHGRYAVHRPLPELLDTLVKEATSIDNVMKAKLNAYNLAKGALAQLQRKKTGNLSVRAVADLVNPDLFVRDSEFLTTLLVAVPSALTADWRAKYERLASMVVPRSSTQVAADDEYTLFAVVIFKRVQDEFLQKCRENKFIVREFTYSPDLVQKQQEELAAADAAEKELWTELLRVARTNFSESFQLLVHLKVLRLFVESVLRYGLPARYRAIFVKPEPKTTKRALAALQAAFPASTPKSSKSMAKFTSTNSNGGSKGGDDFAGEYQSVLEQEYFGFVLFEVPWIVL